MADPLLALAELRNVPVDIEGTTVIVREFSAFEYNEFTDLRDDKPKAAAYLIHLCVLNEDGSPRWTEDEALTIAKGSSRVVTRLINAIHRISGFGEKH